MTLVFDDLVADSDWLPMDLDQQHFPSYFWHAGGLLRDAPVDFRATFDGAMWVTSKPIDMPRFNRNPLRVRAHFTVPRHHHNMDEMLFVLAGEYSIEYDEDEDQGGGTRTVRVGPGDFFLSRAGTPYTMTAGPEGVTYIETWPKPVTELQTYWHDVGWVRR
ncbi:cupin domain-containing protein [Streptomyces geranii]|uniref:cupin domain-containing protein n=1 Tax=Streptomyces geranii TaxID=2058923 RepID=UPI001E4AB3D7|nr:cupin domain-containing protein [Streptomyces geranii]